MRTQIMTTNNSLPTNLSLNPITVSLFQRITDNQVLTEKQTVTTWTDFKTDYLSKHEISEEKDDWCFIAASFKGNTDEGVELVTDNEGKNKTDKNGNTIIKRVGKNIEQYFLLTLDYDDGMSVEEAKDKFKSYDFVIYTSYNHLVDGVEKFRVVILLKSPVTPDDIRTRKNTLLKWAESVDKSTFSIGRAFYLPSCSQDREEHAQIWDNEGEPLDLLSFKQDESTKADVIKSDSEQPVTQTKHKQFNPAIKEAVKNGLKEIGHVKHEIYFKVAAAMSNAGMTQQAFIEVSQAIKANHDQDYWLDQWKNSHKLNDISPGYLINLLKEYGIKIPTTSSEEKKNNSTKSTLIKLDIELLQKKHDVINELGTLSDDEKKQLDELEKNIETKKKQLEESNNSDQNTFNKDMVDLFNRRLIYFVANTGLIHEYFPDEGKWDEYKIHNFINSEPFLLDEKGSNEILLKFLKSQGRSYLSMGLSTSPLPKGVLNRHRTDHWLQPVEGEYHEIFDILFRSLGDDKEENILHLKQVIGWKYLNPSDYKLPCLVIFGEGGAGKTLLIDSLLATIFGKHQVLATQQDQITNFNGEMAGKMAVLIDESTSDKANMEKFKAMVGREYLNINEKYMKPYVADNTALYFTGGNGAKGAILLGRDKSDRRWSILKVERDLFTHVMEVKSMTWEQAKTWWFDNIDLLKDRNEVAKWLYHVVSIAEKLETTPSELHGIDYQNLMYVQAGPLEWIMENVFDHEDFNYISVSECYGLYKLKCEEFGTFNKMTKPVVMGSINELINKRKLPIEHRKQQKVSRGQHKTPTTQSAWVKMNTKGTVNVVNSYVTEHPVIKGKSIIVDDFYPKPEVKDKLLQEHKDLMDNE
jgi:uncharacterized protein DUF5906